jgi:hypothetical protein
LTGPYPIRIWTSEVAIFVLLIPDHISSPPTAAMVTAVPEIPLFVEATVPPRLDILPYERNAVQADKKPYNVFLHGYYLLNLARTNGTTNAPTASHTSDFISGLSRLPIGETPFSLGQIKD